MASTGPSPISLESIQLLLTNLHATLSHLLPLIHGPQSPATPLLFGGPSHSPSILRPILPSSAAPVPHHRSYAATVQLPPHSTTTSTLDPPHISHPNPVQSRLVTPSQPNPSANPKVQSNGFKAQYKVDAIRASAKNHIPICFRCGDKGHYASSCRNALVCFDCDRLGHRSFHCRSTTLLHPTNPAMTPSQLEELNSRPPIKFSANKENKQFRDVLANGLVSIRKIEVQSTFNLT